MKSIHELSEDVQAKIAAGEVIERPAYIVKELVDNALDAGSKKIIINIEDGGLGKIVVTDDGIGMSREDLAICFKRYTTSKLKTIHDLNRIKTMGFRGEALASIAAVSRLTIRSRHTSDESGGEVIIEDGVLEKHRTKGIPAGTQIIVENIFSKLPGRQKFLKSKESESRLILEIVTQFVLAFPDVRFEFSSGQSKILLFPKNTFEERVRDVVSEKIFSFLIPFKYEENYLKVFGFTSKPQISYKSTRNLYTFLNNRFIHEPSIISIIKKTYGTLLEPATHPHLILFISIPHQFVDVNVHPRKETVHFSDEQVVLQSIQSAIRGALDTAELRYLDKRWNRDGKLEDVWGIRIGETNSKTASFLRRNIIQKNRSQIYSKNNHYFQLHNLYIVSESEEGIIFFDQHAVHERILYEELSKKYSNSKQRKFFLKTPYPLDLSELELTVLKEFQNELEKNSFEFEVSEKKVQLTSIPELLKDHNPETVVKDILDDLIENGVRANFETIPHKMLAYLSCRGAVKSGDILHEKQCRELIKKLQHVKNPYTCPHGRPTQVEFSLKDLHKQFKRI